MSVRGEIGKESTKQTVTDSTKLDSLVFAPFFGPNQLFSFFSISIMAWLLMVGRSGI